MESENRFATIKAWWRAAAVSRPFSLCLPKLIKLPFSTFFCPLGHRPLWMTPLGSLLSGILWELANGRHKQVTWA